MLEHSKHWTAMKEIGIGDCLCVRMRKREEMRNLAGKYNLEMRASFVYEFGLGLTLNLVWA